MILSPSLLSADCGDFAGALRDLEAAASFCMAHAMDGMRPMAPKSLKQAWNHLIERSVHEYARA